MTLHELKAESPVSDEAAQQFETAPRRARHTAQTNVATNDQFLALAATIPGVVYQRRVRPDGDIRYTYMSESAEELFGVSARQILDDPEVLFRHYDPAYRESFKTNLIKASKEMKLWDVEATIIRPDGQKRFTHAIARPTAEPDGSVLWTGVILDASRIKEAEQAAAAAEARTRLAIVESLSQGFLMFNSDDKLIVHNSHFLKLYPLLADFVKPGCSYIDLLHAELDSKTNPHLRFRDAHAELVDRLVRHGAAHMVYERDMDDNRHILVTEYRTPGNETVVLYTDITELKQREQRIKHLAHHDTLTGLPNRTLFRERLDAAISDAAMRGETVSVLCLDLDRFKNVNDTLGHHVGDKLLQNVAQRIKQCIRGKDMACRLGGDEFAIIVNRTEGHDAATKLAWRLLETLARPFEIDDHSIISGTSVGIALSMNGDVSAEDILKNADLALYRAKQDGRGTFRFFEKEMDLKAQQRRVLEIELRAAIALGQLEVHYQPLVDASSARMIGVEALARWNHPVRGYVPPCDFIPLAEETGLIVEIGAFILDQACKAATGWPNDIRVAVNVSPAQFKNSDFAKTVKNVILESGLAPERLELEITESLLLRNTDVNLGILYELKQCGIRISMDDFGTGYSSLGNLRSFPFDKIKIDKSFISDLHKTSDAQAIIHAVLTLGRSLGMSTTAEGVETKDQLSYLQSEGCLEIQGHYYAKAMPVAEIESFLKLVPGRIMEPTVIAHA